MFLIVPGYTLARGWLSVGKSPWVDEDARLKQQQSGPTGRWRASSPPPPRQPGHGSAVALGVVMDCC